MLGELETMLADKEQISKASPVPEQAVGHRPDFAFFPLLLTNTEKNSVEPSLPVFGRPSYPVLTELDRLDSLNGFIQFPDRRVCVCPPLFTMR